MRQKSVFPLAVSYARVSGRPKTQSAVWLMLAIAPRPAMGTKTGSDLFQNAECVDTDALSAQIGSNHVWEDAC